MEEVMTFASILCPIALALVQLVKKTAPIKNRYLPLISLIVGLLLGLSLSLSRTLTQLYVYGRAALQDSRELDCSH
ncbi:holin [Terribacillus saccharophilus]|uniref:holin n=1 Tax=Terribacillus saccharophilus TaxID=361277 RepID=UPI00389A8418